MHGSARLLLGAIKQTKNRARLLLARPQCRLASEWQHWSQSASRRSARSQIFLKEFLPTPTIRDQTPSDFDYAGLVVVAVFKINSKYFGITRSLGTRRTLGILKLLKCIDKAKTEPCYKKTQLTSRNYACENRELRSHFIFARAPQPWFPRKLVNHVMNQSKQQTLSFIVCR